MQPHCVWLGHHPVMSKSGSGGGGATVSQESGIPTANDLFLKGKYLAAARAYTQVLLRRPGDAVIHFNRAACYLGALYQMRCPPWRLSGVFVCIAMG